MQNNVASNEAGYGRLALPGARIMTGLDPAINEAFRRHQIRPVHLGLAQLVDGRVDDQDVFGGHGAAHWSLRIRAR